MKIKYITLVIGIIFFKSINIMAQEVEEKAELKVGDQIPTVAISETYPGSIPLKNLKENYQRGGLIINFWASWCVPCVKEMELLGKLAKKYQTKLTVLSVTHENKETSKAFFGRHPEIDISGLTVVNGDKSFIKLFPHRYLPHNIWIDQTGMVKMITDGEQMNEKNIAKFLDHEKIDFNLKQDNLKFDALNAFLPSDSVTIYRKSISGNQSGIGAGSLIGPLLAGDKRDRIFGYNNTIGQLYWTSFYPEMNNSSEVNKKLLEVHVRDSLKILQPKSLTGTNYRSNKEWRMKNTYSYEIFHKTPIPQGELFAQMKADLVNTFGYSAVLRKKNRKAMIIKFSGKANSLRSSGGEKIFELTAKGVKIHNMKIHEIIGRFNSFFTALDPMIDDTKIDLPIDLELINPNSADGLNFKKVMALMNDKGFLFESKIRKVNILSIEDGIESSKKRL
ncbi:thiol-disulfide isomerase/thioredoxin [Flavobacterium sp. W4I14]|nr:thiol-disulfide isomerase/thioredoxin [Flavobacterium sp. W4I14]